MKLFYVISMLPLVLLIFFFYPKNSGGPLCGPICPELGLHYYRQLCFGIERTNTEIDSNTVTCYGWPVGETKCYGTRYDPPSSRNVQLPCDYPCTDAKIRTSCQSAETLTFGSIKLNCDALKTQCNW